MPNEPINEPAPSNDEVEEGELVFFPNHGGEKTE